MGSPRARGRRVWGIRALSEHDGFTNQDGRHSCPHTDYMLSKTVHSLSKSTSEMIHGSVDMVRGLTLSEAGDLLRFARRRLNEEKLPQVASSLTFTTTLALVPLLTIILAIFTTFPVFSTFRTSLETYF